LVTYREGEGSGKAGINESKGRQKNGRRANSGIRYVYKKGEVRKIGGGRKKGRADPFGKGRGKTVRCGDKVIPAKNNLRCRKKRKT